MTRARRNAGHDEQRRRAEREAAASGVDDETHRLTLLLRSGELQPWHMRTLSALGYLPAQVVAATPAINGYLAATREDWLERLRKALTPGQIRGVEDSLIPYWTSPSGSPPGPGGAFARDLDLQKQLLRVAGIGACTASQALLYGPLVGPRAAALRADGLDATQATYALDVFRSTVNTARHDPQTYVGISNDANTPIARLRDLRNAINRIESISSWPLANHVDAVANLASYMRDLLSEPRTWISGYSSLLGSVFDRLEAAFDGALEIDSDLHYYEQKATEPLIAAVIAAQNRMSVVRGTSQHRPGGAWSIRETDGLGYWSNEYGWCAAADADVFTDEERGWFKSIPPRGEWVPGPPTPEAVAVGVLLRQAAIDLLIPWLLTGPIALAR